MLRNISIFLVLLCLGCSGLFGYETVKATKIVANPNDYKNQNVLIYVKFGQKTGPGVFDGSNVRGLEYRYDTKDKALEKKISKLKRRDLITITGKVVLDRFLPAVEIDGIVNGWIDTTLLPPTPKEVKVKCPHCGSMFKHKLDQ